MHKIKLLPLIILITGLFGVINTFEESYTIKNNINTPLTSLEMPSIDFDELIKQDQANSGPGIPMRFSHAFDVKLNIDNSGSWHTLENGDMIWKLGIHSKDAFGIKLLFDSFYLPDGSELYIYSKEENMSLGPYTSKQNNLDETFGIPLVKSDHIIIEYYQPKSIFKSPKLSINKVFHAYVDIHNFYGERDNRDCGDNVVCSNANSWNDQINSVIYLEMGQYICSAALINNTNQDKKPYVLTAYHCVEGQGNLGQQNWFTFYFNHQSSSCNSSSGYYGQSETGSYIRSWGNMNSSDFALLEMNDDPPSWWNPYFAGWSRYSSQTLAAGIHHPGGQPKKINFDNDSASNCGWYGNNTHYCLNWDQGGTAGGSSGSPLFNSSKLIVGQLSGGSGAECSGSGTDYYGKFTHSWSNSNSSAYNLKYWLDPSNTGTFTLQGTYDGILTVYGCTDNNACNYNPEATNNDGSCEYPQGSCNCEGTPVGNYCDCNYSNIDECGICNGDGSSCANTVDLSFGYVDGNNGTAEIVMQNDVSIAGFQFVINNSPDYLDLINIGGGSSSNYYFTISSSENGSIVGFSLSGNTIPAGQGTLLTAFFDTNLSDDLTVDLCLSDPVFSDDQANGLPVNLGPCKEMNFSNILYGDINGDNIINVLDVVVLVNMVLGLSSPSEASDLNNDIITNVLDVVILVNIILTN